MNQSAVFERETVKRMKIYLPERIVCFTEETVEILYLLSEQVGLYNGRHSQDL